MLGRESNCILVRVYTVSQQIVSLHKIARNLRHQPGDLFWPSPPVSLGVGGVGGVGVGGGLGKEEYDFILFFFT